MAAAVVAVGLLVAVGLGWGSPAAARGRVGAAHKLCLVPGVGKPLEKVWRPNILSAIGYHRRRIGDIAFAVRMDGALYGYRVDHDEWSASVVKAMLMVAYLNRPSIANHNLSAYDRSLLIPMITRSDNYAASVVDSIVGSAGLNTLAARVGMTHFTPAQPIWGETEITPSDQTKFFLHIDRFIPPLHRYLAMKLLASIVPSQRWGIGEVAPRGWKLYFKGGWGYGTGLIDHQVILLTRGCARVSIAVLTMHDGSHEYGKQTLRGIFVRLLKGLPTGAQSRYRRAAPNPGQRQISAVERGEPVGGGGNRSVGKAQ